MIFNWETFIEYIKHREIVGYGAGVNAYRMLESENFRPYFNKVRFFIDQDPNKVNTYMTTEGQSYAILSIDSLNRLNDDTVVLVTITDYMGIGKVLDEKGIIWFPWTIVSADFSFSILENVVDQKKPICYLLNTPDYMNLGDHAITVAESIYIKKNWGDYYEFGTGVCGAYGLSKLKRYIKSSDILFVQGGGNMGSLWRVCEENLRSIIKTFPQNRIIVFPQSVYYGDSEEEKAYFRQSLEIYNSHHKLLICTREQQSFDFVTKSYKCDCMLLPDMVLTLKYNSEAKREGIGILLRNDKEKYIPPQYSKVVEEAVRQIGERVKMISHHPVARRTSREESIQEILDLYASCKLVITDRLHGMIFSALTNTPCIAFDNSYHKVFGVYNTWMKERNNIICTQPVTKEELVQLISGILKNACAPYDAEIYIDKFNELTKYLLG